MDLDRDPIVSVVHRGIKADIRTLLDHEGYRGAVLLTYAGMDAMADLTHIGGICCLHSSLAGH